MPDTLIQRLRAAEPQGEEFRHLVQELAREVHSRYEVGDLGAADYMTKAVQLLRALPGIDPAEPRVNALLDAGHYFYLAGHPFSALEPVQTAVDLARLAGNDALLRKALTIAGISYADSGDISRGIECYDEGLQVALRIGDVQGELSVWANLGAALLYAAQYRDAMACFERVLSRVGDKSEFVRFRCVANSNIALCSLHLEEYGRGLPAIERAIREGGEPTQNADLVARALRENFYTRLLLKVDAIEKAGERCRIGRLFADRSKSLRAIIPAMIAEGLYEVHAGLIDVGITRLKDTLEKSRKLPVMQRDTQAALVQAYELMGQPQMALIYLREMMESIRQQQQERALRHVNQRAKEVAEAMSGESTVTTRLARREAALQAKVSEQEVFQSRTDMLERLAITAELRDDSTGLHAYRVGRLAGLLAVEAGMDPEKAALMELAARLHDIGKVSVPDGIVLKPGALNDSELQLMRSHANVGADLLAKSNIPKLDIAVEIARYHHERWDGRGYPTGLAGEGIPLPARVVAIADAFDAMTHPRRYRDHQSIDGALEEIASLKGSQFDPKLVDLFVALIARLRAEHDDLDAFLGAPGRQSKFLRARSRIWDELHKDGGNDEPAARSSAPKP